MNSDLKIKQRLKTQHSDLTTK